MSAPAVPSCTRRRLARPSPARCKCARCSAPSAAARSGSFLPAKGRGAGTDPVRPPLMGGPFPFPVKYGYATVGRVEAGAAEWRQRVVFSLHPHQSLFTLPTQAVVPVPEDVPPRRAVLAANMETALNAVWDGAPGPAD